jgi:hypothetical protein
MGNDTFLQGRRWGRLALAVALLAGCSTGPIPLGRSLEDASLYDLKKPGITCMRGLHFVEARGCSDDVAPGTAELCIRQRDEMSNTFLLVSALYAVDGRVAYVWNKEPERAASSGPVLQVAADNAGVPSVLTAPAGAETASGVGPGAGAVARIGEPIFDAAMPPGEHLVQVSLAFQGNGYGVFSYLRSYKFNVRSSHSQTVAPDRAVYLTVVASDRADRIDLPLEERPRVCWDEVR